MADDISLNSFRTSIVEHASQCSEVICGFSSERSEDLPVYMHEASRSIISIHFSRCLGRQKVSVENNRLISFGQPSEEQLQSNVNNGKKYTPRLTEAAR